MKNNSLVTQIRCSQEKMKTILVIKNKLDDELLQIIEFLLQEEGWQVLNSNVEDISLLLEVSRVNLIICHSEIMSLQSHLKVLKEKPKIQTIPILLLATNINRQMSEYGSYIADWVTLPFDKEEILERVSSTME